MFVLSSHLRLFLFVLFHNKIHTFKHDLTVKIKNIYIFTKIQENTILFSNSAFKIYTKHGTKYLVQSFEGSEANSNISNTRHGGKISRIEKPISNQTILHILRQSFGHRITQYESGAAKSLIERERVIRH